MQPQGPLAAYDGVTWEPVDPWAVYDGIVLPLGLGIDGAVLSPCPVYDGIALDSAVIAEPVLSGITIETLRATEPASRILILDALGTLESEPPSCDT